jgi:hypothetical protein
VRTDDIEPVHFGPMRGYQLSVGGVVGGGTVVPSQVLVSVREELFDAMLPRETPAMQRLVTRRYESFKESLAAQIGASGTALGPVAVFDRRYGEWAGLREDLENLHPVYCSLHLYPAGSAGSSDGLGTEGNSPRDVPGTQSVGVCCNPTLKDGETTMPDLLQSGTQGSRERSGFGMGGFGMGGFGMSSFNPQQMAGGGIWGNK